MAMLCLALKHDTFRLKRFTSHSFLYSLLCTDYWYIAQITVHQRDVSGASTNPDTWNYHVIQSQRWFCLFNQSMSLAHCRPLSLLSLALVLASMLSWLASCSQFFPAFKSPTIQDAPTAHTFQTGEEAMSPFPANLDIIMEWEATTGIQIFCFNDLLHQCLLSTYWVALPAILEGYNQYVSFQSFHRKTIYGRQGERRRKGLKVLSADSMLPDYCAGLVCPLSG